MKENLNRLIKNQATLNVEGLLFKKDGSSFNVRCRKRPILNEILKCTGISYLCEDITETKIWKQKLNTYASHDFLIGDILNEEAFYTTAGTRLQPRQALQSALCHAGHRIERHL